MWFVFQKHGLLIVRFAMIRTFSEKTTPEPGRGGGISIFVLKKVYFKLLTDLSANGTIIRTKITCKKIPCYMRDSACRWFIVKKTKIFWTHIKHFELSRVREKVESWLVYAKKTFWIAQPYFSTDIRKRSYCQLIFLWSVNVLIVIISLYFNETKAKSNCFNYIWLSKHCLVIKLGEFKNDQKYFAR